MTTNWRTSVEHRGDDAAELFSETINGGLRAAEQRGVAKRTLDGQNLSADG